ncbi:uncharacterized protein LOC144116104 isoform X1 [Amblyomma americanum]
MAVRVMTAFVGTASVGCMDSSVEKLEPLSDTHIIEAACTQQTLQGSHAVRTVDSGALQPRWHTYCLQQLRWPLSHLGHGIGSMLEDIDSTLKLWDCSKGNGSCQDQRTTVYIWNLQTKEVIQKLQGHTGMSL